MQGERPRLTAVDVVLATVAGGALLGLLAVAAG
jgi:hypothetical protein